MGPQKAYFMLILFDSGIQTASFFWILSPTVSKCPSLNLNHTHPPFKPMSEEKTSECCSKFRFDLAFANLLLRLWIGLRLVGAGIDKWRAGSCWGFKGVGPDGAEIDIARGVTFSADNYDKKLGAIAKLTFDKGFLPKPLCDLYAKPLGYILVGVGAWVIIGLLSELSLFAAGLVFLSLGVGLATLPDDTEVVLIGIQILIVAAALATSKHKNFSLDGLFFGRKKSD